MLWMNTSGRVSRPDKSLLTEYLRAYPSGSKIIASGIFLLASVLCAVLLGTGSGLFASVVILMAVGSVTVLLFPFRYFGRNAVIVIYGICLLFEIMIA